MALSNSGSGVVGAMSYPLGVHFGIPHGFAGGIFLPDIIEHNTKADYDFTGLLDPYASATPFHHLFYMIGDLWKRLEVPNLKQWIKPEQLKQAQDLVYELPVERNQVPFYTQTAQEWIARHM